MSRLQRWLSSRPPRSDVSNLSVLPGPQESVLFEWIKAEKEGVMQPVLQATYDLSHPFNRDGKATPPLHIHLTQDEYFQVMKGSLGFVLNGKKGTLGPETKPGLIPAGGRHTFWLDLDNCDGSELIFHCWVSPHQVEHGWDELFFRNFQAYLADCARHGMKPSKFQSTLFRYEADTVLTPAFWLPKWLLRSSHHIIAHWIGEGLLGYQAQYPEYGPMTPRGPRYPVRKDILEKAWIRIGKA